MSGTLPLPSNKLDLHDILAIVNDEVMSALATAMIDDGVEKTLRLYLSGPLQNIRFNLFDQSAIDRTWADIRDSEVVTDLVLDLTTILRFHVGAIGDNAWKQLIRLTADAFSVFGNSSGTSSAIVNLDDERRYLNNENAVVFVDANPWLITLFLMRQTSVVKTFHESLADVARQLRAKAASQAGNP